MSARTLFDKVWAAHEVVAETPDTPAVLYIDLHLIHEVTSPQAFSLLRGLGLPLRRPDRTLATMDHSTPISDTPAVLYIDLHLIHEVTSPQAFSLLRGLGLPLRRPDRTLATMDHSTPISDTPAVLYIDLHLIHEVTSPQAFSVLKAAGLPVRRPDRTLATMDHSTPTSTDQVFGNVPIKVDAAAKQVRQLEQNTAEFGIELFGMRDARRGIVHVISPELGATQPGMTIVCGDSHTSTHGAFGALAFGIGTTEVGHVFATQALLQRKPKTFAVNVEGRLRPGVTAKDLILAVIGKIGVSGGTGHVFEYRGSAVRALSMDERMTVCNMSIEAGARAGMIAPDDTTFAYLEGKPRAPKGAAWDAARARWKTFVTDPGAVFDASVDIDAVGVEPMITYGTNPGMVLPIGASIPHKAGDEVFDKALRYMGFHSGDALLATR